jgi:hypothetical protein
MVFLIDLKVIQLLVLLANSKIKDIVNREPHRLIERAQVLMNLAILVMDR